MSRMLTFHPHKPELAVPGMAPSLPSLARLEHYSPLCTLTSCQALHMFALLCQAWKTICRSNHELHMSITKFRSLFNCSLGFHSLPIEQGRLGNSCVPDTCTGAHCAPIVPWVMSGTAT